MGDTLELFFKLEASLNECEITNKPFILTKDQAWEINRTYLDFELFKYDFDLTCSFIGLLSRLEKNNFTLTQVKLVKYIFILSNYLNNSTSTKISSENQFLLERAKDFLGTIVSISSFSLSIKEFNEIYFDSCKILAAFALVNIHECVGIKKAFPIHRGAQDFLNNEIKLNSAESNLVSYVFWNCPDDFALLGSFMDELVASETFKKYNTNPRLNYRKSFEKQKLFVFYMFMASFTFITCVLVEILISNYI